MTNMVRSRQFNNVTTQTASDSSIRTKHQGDNLTTVLFWECEDLRYKWEEPESQQVVVQRRKSQYFIYRILERLEVLPVVYYLFKNFGAVWSGLFELFPFINE